MYPVRLGYDTAVRRIRRLMRNDHHSEALVTSVFTLEKAMRRVLRALIVSAGFPIAQTTVLMTKFDGLGKIKDVWECFPMRKDQVDLQNAIVWIPDSKTPTGVAEAPLSSLAIEAFKVVVQ